MASVVFDLVDRKILHALCIAPRAPWGRIGAAIGVSDQTVARRYRVLTERAGVRVTGLIDPARAGWGRWLLRLWCTPDAAELVAEALARRSDTSWVRVASGGTEVHCSIQTASDADPNSLLLDRLAGSRRVVSLAAYSLLHTFAGAGPGWPAVVNALDADEQARLADGSGPPVSADAVELGGSPLELSPADQAMLSVLGRNGRAGYAELGAAAGWHESTARRRIEALTSAGLLYFDVDVDERAFGVRYHAVVWLAVVPSRLAAVGEAIAADGNVPFVAATSGPTNLLASVLCADSEALYRFLSERIGPLEGLVRVETAPIMRVLKRTGLVTA
ncbi:MAG TPA: AsnC family transcriptional regulator [Acidimicrobiales bacterium]|nr:AsnC family transcriptional regulator [Acidimicrobiales bacterium]